MNRKKITWSVHIASLFMIAVLAVSYLHAVLPNARGINSFDFFNPQLGAFEETETYREHCINAANNALRYSWLKERIAGKDTVLVTREGKEKTLCSYSIDNLPYELYSGSKSDTDIVWCAFFPRFSADYDPAYAEAESSMKLSDYFWDIEETTQFYMYFENKQQQGHSNVLFSITQNGETLFNNGCTNPNYTLTLQHNGDYTISPDLRPTRADTAYMFSDSNYFLDSSSPITISLEINNDYPYNDDFRESYHAFAAVQETLPMLIWLAVGISVWFVTFLLLIIFTDKLYSFDKLWLEPFAAVWGAVLYGIGALFIYLISILDYMNFNTGNTFQLTLMCTALAAVFILLWITFLIPCLSLVRRLKARVFWKYSMTGKLCGVVKRFWQLAYTSQREGKKVFICSVLFTLLFFIHIFAVIISRDYRTSFTSFFLLLVLALLFFYLARRLLLQAKSRDKLIAATDELVTGNVPALLNVDDFAGDDRLIADNLNHIGTGLKNAVETATKSERMKTELITNVSHDIKTPLTSIINYTDLLKREKFDNETAAGYVRILEEKAQKLKQLTEDLVEASKASSGNISLEMNRLNFTELLHQVNGEFAEKLEEADLQLIETVPEEALCIIADGRYLWRVLENLYTNALKYAMPHTRVYAALTEKDDCIHFSLKNISAEPLNLAPEELTERFTRGDASRNSEGSGLGLAIAKSLTELQNGTFNLRLDGDLFRIDLTFPKV